jgi:hypothetical protein
LTGDSVAYPPAPSSSRAGMTLGRAELVQRRLHLGAFLNQGLDRYVQRLAELEFRPRLRPAARAWRTLSCPATSELQRGGLRRSRLEIVCRPLFPECCGLIRKQQVSKVPRGPGQPGPRVPGVCRPPPSRAKLGRAEISGGLCFKAVAFV